MAAKVYTELKDILDPAHTCLVVWDVQNGLVKNIFNQDDFLSSLKKLITAARRHNVPLVYTRITPLPPAYQSGWNIYRNMQRFGVTDPAKLPVFMATGSKDAEIHTDVAPMESDHIFAKHAASIFMGTYFETMMRNRGVETLVFTGIATEIGIASSVRDAGNLGFYPVVASDCVSSASMERHDATLISLPAVSLVLPSSKIIEQWG